MPAPALSICIPTHDGRLATFGEAIGSVLAQLGPRTEICVSDNASTDGTEQFSRRLAEQYAGTIEYRRHPRNLGGPRNLRSAVEMASGEWCWLLSSDDALMPGALPEVRRLIGRHPDASGITVGWRPFERDLIVERQGSYDSPPRNAGTAEHVLQSSTEIVERIAPLLDYMSIHVFRRDLWLRAAAELDPVALDGTKYPTTFVLGRLCLARPHWVWSPANAIKTRAGNESLADHGAVDFARVRRDALRDVERVWAQLLGSDRVLRRRVAAQWVAMYADRDALLTDRRDPGTSVQSRLALLAGLGRATWRTSQFWRTTVPTLALPLRPELRPCRPLPAAQCRTQVQASPIGPLGPGASRQLSCEIENRGGAILRSTPPNPVHLASRWFDVATGKLVLDGRRTRLDPPLPPGHRARYPLQLTTPTRPGEYLVRIAPVQEHVMWFDDLAPENGCTLRLTVSA